jgi:hypothetical protein
MFGLSASALLGDRVPAEGLYDAAVANGLAAIVAAELPGRELDANGKVLAPLGLLKALTEGTRIDIATLKEGVILSQAFRHGRAEDEWNRITGRHLAALVALDGHDALGVVGRANGRTFESFILELYDDETAEHFPSDPKDRSLLPEPTECPECNRNTVIGEGWDEFGVGLAAGAFCIACGYESTREDVISEAMDRAMERPD